MLFRSSSVKRGSLASSSFEKIIKYGIPGPSAEVWIPVQEDTADKAVDQALVRSQERRLVMVPVRFGKSYTQDLVASALRSPGPILPPRCCGP